MDFITKDEAVAALRGSARIPQVSTCGHTGCTDHQADDSPVVHVWSHAGDADWTIDNAVQFVTGDRRAVAWAGTQDFMVVLADGAVYRFDVRRPGA